MCDICSELLELLQISEQKSYNNERLWLRKSDVAVVCTYVQGWTQRQCMCCYKEAKQFEAFNNVLQGILHIALEFLNQQSEERQAQELPRKSANDDGGGSGDQVETCLDPGELLSQDKVANGKEQKKEDVRKHENTVEQASTTLGQEEWSMDERERLLHFISKTFLLNFPLYVAYKHSIHSKLEDPEIPVYLLRNVCFFCDRGGINAMTNVFKYASPQSLSFPMAHAMINVVSNLKLWMNINSIVQCLVPLRTNVIRYMCKLSDKDLRVAGTRNLSEFMWTAVKDPLDAHLTFDREGLDLAFKYFISSTLTMRLAGITQINNHINIYNELCNSETFMETESVGLGLANWLIQNKIIEHIFGPNLHVEIIKQCHVVLNFLAMEGRIREDHIDCIWVAAQLKHCSKQVHDLLPPLIKNLEAQPVLHLYCLLCKLEPKDHTEQTLYLASALIKFIWSNGGGSHGNLAMNEHGNSHTPFSAVLKNSVNVTDLEQVGLAPTVKHDASSSEHSVSVEASYSEEDEQSDSHPVHNTSEVDSSQLSDKRLSSNEGSEGCPKDRLLCLSKAKRVCRQRQQHRKQAISHREPGEISEIDESSASSAALDSDMSNVSNDSLPSEEDEVGSPNMAVSSLNTLSDSEDDDDSENEDSPTEEVVDRPRRKCFRRHKLRQLIKASKKKELNNPSGNLAKSLREPEQKLPDLKNLVHKANQNSVEGAKLQNPANNVSGNVVELMELNKEVVVAVEDCPVDGGKIACAKSVKLASEENVDGEPDLKGRKEIKQDSAGHKGKLTDVRGEVTSEANVKKSGSKPDANVLSCAIEQSVPPPNEDKSAETDEEPVTAVAFVGDRVSEMDVQDFPRIDETLETEVYDCREYLQQMHAEQHLHEPCKLIEDILSPDDGSCSSRISNKSEKNMADFEGEESGCDDELARLAAHADTQLSPHQMQQRFAASIYHENKVIHRASQKECNQAVGQFEIDKVCNPGNTLLWDLLQDETVNQLGEGLAAEAEKVLCNLVCWSTNRLIRMKFIEGCLGNLENNRSVVISLRLLPKLFSSFQPYRGGMDNHSVTLWAEKELKMMKHFFNNLVAYTNSFQLGKKSYAGMYSHQTEIQVRLQFLTCVFSSMGSPESFRLTLEQVDIMWSCLATDQECSDELFSWLLNQAKNKDQHAMGLETFKHIFMEKMPLLSPETTSMTALNLYQQLGGITRLTISDNETKEICGMDQLWGIALRAENTDVSMAAIQYLNSYYVNLHHGTLEKEEEFIERCMTSLRSVSDQFDEGEDSRLIIIQRGLLLLKTHLETFHRRYAYHLRLWHLEGRGIGCHQQSLNEKQSSLLRVICQPGGLSDKVTFEFLGSDYVADLRAEITKWWEQFCPHQQLKKQEPSTSSQEIRMRSLNSNLESGNEGFIRMISQGQELTSDLDERPLQEMGFKDLQLVFVSMGAARPQRKRDGLEPTSHLPPPPREKLPMVLLLQPPHFEQLFSLMQQLSSLKSSKKNGEWAPLTKGQLLSRRVWELLMMLPTSPSILRGFHNLISNQGQDTQSALCTLLNPEVPQKLIYSLQIVESLSKTSWMQSTSVEEVVAEQSTTSSWTNQFIKRGGLRHLFDIFMSGRLQAGEGKEWNEWNQDCLAYLLKLINQFGVEPAEIEAIQLEAHESYETPKKKMKRNRRGSSDKLIIPRLSEIMLSMMDVDAVMNALMAVLEQAATTGDPNHYKTGLWGRAQVVHYAIVLLVHWSYSCKAVKAALFSYPHLAKLLKRLLVDDPEPAVRREACTGQYRLCLGTTTDGNSGRKFIVPLLSCLLRFLPETQTMKSVRSELEEDGKEPYGPACRDYFWLVCRLVDHLDEDSLSQQDDQDSPLDLDELGRYLIKAILSRDYLETRHSLVDDDGLIGLVTLCTAVMKHNPTIKFSEEGQEFLLKIFDCLFALPSPKQRHLPKCKSQASRSAAYDLLVELVKGCLENYKALHSCLLQQHSPNSHSPYPWDYWPHEDGRSDCGYVGLTNLGATCYMASCMQHLYMMPQARASILTAKQCTADTKHENTLHELQRMFAYLLESERKSYNPRSFCKVYMMDHQPLNTGEQKDMAEFFTDLISKLEEMTPQLKELVKTLFCGVITNNVVSLDCSHISRTIEESYTVRCQVADMRNLYESLDEVTVKDTLEGDNMYTCSQCGKKVRAEKRACFKKLPKIICFNTMRYTFNMVTMMKEKVNTHFSFPLRLDMSGYTEKHLMPDQYKAEEGQKEDDDVYLYDLIGVTVHTGTADGGHYYSFIKDRTSPNKDKWFLFNDAEVKPFDPGQIAAECFGGEMTSKTYDSVTDKFMDFSFEKTNSAYMLFYERCSPEQGETTELKKPVKCEANDQTTFELSKDLAEWIWQDNMQFLQDKNIFEHTYFNFMWQICGYIPQTISQHEEVTLMSAKLSTSFVLETLIHAKEKPTMVQWIELLTKQFNASQNACEWFLDHMAENEWWPIQILIKCPNQVVRQMFQRLCIHVINKLKPIHMSLYLQPCTDNEDFTDVDVSQVGLFSCVTRFIRKLLMLTEHGAKQHCKHLTEYFTFLLEFAKMGEEESQFLIAIEAISYLINFYLGQKSSEYVDVVSDEDEDEEDDVVSIVDDKYKPASLEKMITLIALLVEKSRGDDHQLHLSQNDLGAVAGGKVFPFLFQQIRDNINIRQTCNLIFSLCRWNERLTVHIVNMIFQAITKHHELNQPFFKLLTLLVEIVGGPPGMPSFTNLVLQHIWEVAEYCPQQCLEWLSIQVPRNKVAHAWVLQNMETWVEHFLIAHSNQRVRNSAAFLLVSLVPNHNFRQSFRNVRTMLSPQKDICMNREALATLHQIYELLLRLLKRAKHYVDQPHGTTKLMSYFAIMTYCLHSRTEKLMFGQYFLDLWQLFQPKLSEPPVPVHQNKQALLIFWYQVSVDCPENVKLIVSNAHVTKNIAFNYILADHDDQEVMIFNRCMLPAYYGLLRLCCQQSRVFTRQLASHQNIQWAFKNITPYSTQYPAAIEELFKLMQLFVMKHPDGTEQELKEIYSFKRTTLQLYLGILDARSCWATLITAFRILLEINEDRFYLLCNNGLPMMFESFHTLHVMYHEATACHVTGDLVELLSIILDVLKCARSYRDTSKEVKHTLLSWKDRTDAARKLVTLLNSYTPGDVRQICIDVLRELLMLYPTEIMQTLVPMLTQCHATFQENNVAGRAFKEIASGFFTFGPYFPKQGQKSLGAKSNIRPQRPMFQMYLHPNQIEAPKGADGEYDQTLHEFFYPYHEFVDVLCRMAINHDAMMEPLINLSAMVGFEGIPLHFTLFPKLWVEICQAEHLDKKYVEMMCTSNYLVDYLETLLIDERTSLNIPVIYKFCSIFLPKVYLQVSNEQLRQQLNSLTSSIASYLDAKDLEQVAYKLNGDLRVISVLFKCESFQQVEQGLISTLQQLKSRCETYRQQNVEKNSSSQDIEDDQGGPSTKRRKLFEDDTDPKSSKMSELPSETNESTNKSSPSGCSSSSSSSSSGSGSSSQLVITTQPESPPEWNKKLLETIDELMHQIQDVSGLNS